MTVQRSDYLEALIRTTEGFVSMAPYALRGGIVRTDEAVEGIVLKGIDTTYDWRLFGEWLQEGALPRVSRTLRPTDLPSLPKPARLNTEHEDYPSGTCSHIHTPYGHRVLPSWRRER